MNQYLLVAGGDITSRQYTGRYSSHMTTLLLPGCDSAMAPYRSCDTAMAPYRSCDTAIAQCRSCDTTMTQYRSCDTTMAQQPLGEERRWLGSEISHLLCTTVSTVNYISLTVPMYYMSISYTTCAVQNFQMLSLFKYCILAHKRSDRAFLARS